MKIVAGVPLLALLLLAACGGDDSAGGQATTTTAPAPTTVVVATTPADGEVPILDVIEGFEYYNPCQNSSLDIDGTTYYVVPGAIASHGDYPDIDESRYPLPAEPEGFARIAPPGPGDDVGTMVVYADGTARFESDSGIVSWFTTEELTYTWEC
jgi:hypothetical protein